MKSREGVSHTMWLPSTALLYPFTIGNTADYMAWHWPWCDSHNMQNQDIAGTYQNMGWVLNMWEAFVERLKINKYNPHKFNWGQNQRVQLIITGGGTKYSNHIETTFTFFSSLQISISCIVLSSNDIDAI